MNQLVSGDLGTLSGLNAALPLRAFRGGWNKAEPSLWREPRTRFSAAAWRWQEAKAGLDAAGLLLSTEQAERRNLFMVNPIEGNTYATLQTLVTAYQMILPGERARSHRHSPAALRLVLDTGPKVYTVVDGVRLDMAPGDVVLTPGWCWHGHANEGDRPAYWIDVLDVPLVQLLEPMFFEEYPGDFQVPERQETASALVFPWSDTEKALDAAKPDSAGRFGARIELGSPALPTMALHMERLAVGMKTRPWRTTANQIFCVVSGAGETWIGEKQIPWSRGDVFVAPSWHATSHRASADTVLFRVSDEPTQRTLGMLREAAAG